MRKDQLRTVLAVIAFLSGLTGMDPGLAQADGVGLPDRIIFVDAGAGGNQTGQDWANAYTDLQAALSEARSLAPAQSVQIWVADGVYDPIDGITPTGVPRYEAFELISHVELYGGFAGGESTLEERDWRANPTVLSGDIDGDDIVNVFGITEHFDDIVGDNSLHVVRARDVGNSARLDGFFITGGLADLGGLVDNTFLMRNGAGIYLLDSQVGLARLQVQGNRAEQSTAGAGGGAYFDRSGSLDLGTPAIQMNDVHFINNRAASGGGLYIDGPLTSIDGAVFIGNEARSLGGGIVKVITVVDIRNALIAGNQAADGGGIYSFRGIAAVVNTQISGNYASANGGGIYFDQAPSLNTPIVLTNSTLNGNRADGIGGGVFHELAEQGRMEINNSVVWGNQDASGIGTAQAGYGGPGASRFEARHSLMQALNPPGDGNLDGTLASSDPLFEQPVDPASAPTAAGDLRVVATSPIIDRGTGDARINPILVDPPIAIEGEILFDLDGNDRITDGTGDGTPVIDLGPFERPTAERFSIGGEVSGLNGEGLVLRLSPDELLPIQANGPFQFSTELLGGSEYLVSVVTQPIRPPQLCEINNAGGVVSGEVTDVEVICSDRADELFGDRFESM